MQEIALKAQAMVAAWQEVERKRSADEKAKAAGRAAEKLREIEEQQKQTQQLILYVPFAKKVVQAVEKVCHCLTCAALVLYLLTAMMPCSGSKIPDLQTFLESFYSCHHVQSR
ncbi:MAG: hypothetical protein HC767_07290 [Akkermansiaceae bacterium]|nr:hypothetical protein [Akkermansiaceae bacterium]